MKIFARWKLRWETWDLRVVILFSLGLQIFLIFFAPLRKRVSTAWITTPIWLAYLLADATATFAVGLISNSQGDTSGPFAYPPLLAFMAPFLLVHLGGPDTITAFALEDNELWLRHLLGLGFQCSAIIYAFFQSFPSHKLWVPTVLMFAAGVIKYIERSRALYLASYRRVKASFRKPPDPGPNYLKMTEVLDSKMEARHPAKIEIIPESSNLYITEYSEYSELSDLRVLQVAHNYFATFKGLIADLTFSFRQRNKSRDYFLGLTAKDAFKIVEVELNFFYDILYTKATIVQGTLGCTFRFLSFIFGCVALVLFYLIDKEEFEKLDTGICYTLLFGAISLDFIASMLVVHSDWTTVALTKSDYPNWFIKILRKLLNVNRVRCPKSHVEPSCFSLRIRKIMQRRWSESLSTFNLMNYCLHPRAEWWEETIGFIGLTSMLDGKKYVETEEFTDCLRDFIVQELKMKSEYAIEYETTKEIVSARGDWILLFENCTNLIPWISDVDFDTSLILWHIATELCFYTNEEADTNSKLSKILSGYMLYLLIMHPTMLSTMAGMAEKRFIDTCAETKKLLHEMPEEGTKKLLHEMPEEGKNRCLDIFNFGKCFRRNESQIQACERRLQRQKQACVHILNVSTSVQPITFKGDKSKTLLFDACILAKELKKLERKRMWEIVSKVWVELLSYAACCCGANTHMAQLNKGGQLLTLVWLLMVHLGLGNHFEISRRPRAKLIVGK